MDSSNWYGVRTIYEHEDMARGRERLYEERVVLIRAGSHEEAINKAEQEAETYSAAGSRYLGLANSFELFDEPAEKIEVFSLMRNSRLEPKRYLKVFFDTGRERQESVGETISPVHLWTAE